MIEENAAFTRRLRALGNQMMQVAADITRQNAPPHERSVFAGLDRDSDLWLIAAKDMYAERLGRREHFPDGLLGEPAWDILLDLYIAEKENRAISVTSACLGAQAPMSTGLRWLQMLEALRLVSREHDRKDARRRLVRITEEGYARMTKYLAAQRPGWLAEEAASASSGTRAII